MIMPCMNSTSAGASGGNEAWVEGGKVLVGCPGAPGCTTTGAAAVRLPPPEVASWAPTTPRALAEKPAIKNAAKRNTILQVEIRTGLPVEWQAKRRSKYRRSSDLRPKRLNFGVITSFNIKRAHTRYHEATRQKNKEIQG